LGIDEARSALFRQAKGSVLEIGAGTGLNLEKYDFTQISSLTLLDISMGMLTEAKKRVSAIPALRGISVQFVKADATSELLSAFGPSSFDTVVDSFSLCVMGNIGARQCLDQVRQVVKSQQDGGKCVGEGLSRTTGNYVCVRLLSHSSNEGKVLLLENSRSSNSLFGLYQDATADTAAMAGGKGCVYNQDVGAMIRDTKGMKIEQEELYAVGLFRAFRCVVL
jgi:ubiquinone/menaquinone biosynthesis C-methylase UbiE